MTSAGVKATRVVLKASFRPVVGSAFQPTGFPDLGAAEFERPGPDGTTTRALLVESVQSLANHLEATTWDRREKRPVDTLEGIPHVEVSDKEGRFLTSSRLDPHRLAGAYVREAKLGEETVGQWLTQRLQLEEGVPTNWEAVYTGLFETDPLCLVHGVFLSDKQWSKLGNPKVRRAVTAVMEAHGVRPVVSGGVKRDDVNPTHGERSSSEGYGFVPFGRTEYTADRIELGVAVDLEQIRGYGLGVDETDLLEAIALWEVRTLLDNPLRLRTACDLELAGEVKVRRPDGWELPDTDALEARISSSTVGFDEPVYRATFE